MWLYKTWIYQHMINTDWMILAIVSVVFGFNIVSPIFIYYSLAEKKPQFNLLKFYKKKTNKDQTTGS